MGHLSYCKRRFGMKLRDVKTTTLHEMNWKFVVFFNLSSVSHSVMSDSLRPHGLQHSRFPCPSPTPRVCKLLSIELVIPSNHLTLCCPLLLLPSVFPASGSFLMSLHFTSGSQSIGVSASASVLPKSSQGWFPLGLTSLISFQSRGLSRLFSNTTVQEHHFFSAQPSLWSSSHIHTWLLEKP